MTFLTINVWSGLDYVGNMYMGEYESSAVREQRYELLLRELREYSPDVIGVQEANKLPEYGERLARDLGYDVVSHMGVGGVRVGPVGLPWNLREGDALLAKRDLNLRPVGRRRLSGGYVGGFFSFHFSDATQILGGKISSNGRDIFVYVTHWHAGLLELPKVREEARELSRAMGASELALKGTFEEIEASAAWRMGEARDSLDFLRETAGNSSLVLLGDFNATRETAEIQFLLKHGLRDSYFDALPAKPGYTWSPQSNLNQKKHYYKLDVQKAKQEKQLLELLTQQRDLQPRRIDYVFLGAGKDYHTKSSRVVLDRAEENIHASDHYGVLTEVEFDK